ncbi:MAG: response regulator transcription factor [Desulfobacterales bacterium]|nr:response regulator transcription factor [Desulfobacterales bacterium]
MAKPKIVIAEDHKLFRAGLRLLITSTLGLDVVGEAGDGIEALRLVRQKQPDLLLVDLSMPNMGGIEAIRQVRQLSPETKILVVSMHSSESYLKAALQAGAQGYLLKIADQNEFRVAVSAIIEGKFYISSEFTSKVIEAYFSGDNSEKSSLDLLTNREREILKLVAEGQANKQIAALLCIAPKTVDNHRTNIMRKLDLHSALDLSNYARQHGLLVEE